MALLDNALVAGIAIAFYLFSKQTTKPAPGFFVSPQVQDGLGPRDLGLRHPARAETRNIGLKLDHTVCIPPSYERYRRTLIRHGLGKPCRRFLGLAEWHRRAAGQGACAGVQRSLWDACNSRGP